MRYSFYGMVTAGIAQLVEHHVANVNVASSSLVSRSKYIPLSRGNPWIKSEAGPCGCLLIPSSASGYSFSKGITLAGWQSGYAAACKAADAGSIPTPASIFLLSRPGGGIGRHKGLKIPRGKLRAGSSPAPGTI